MPKLQEKTIARNQRRIESAALRLFIRRGFHGTSVRDLAAEAGVSIGNVYTYYGTKQELFESVVARYQQRMFRLQRELLTPLAWSADERSLWELAKCVRQIVYEEPDYWRLMYVDVTEFGNRHFASSFRDLARTLDKFCAPSMKRSKGLRPEIDRSLAYTHLYLQFFTYFLVEKLFGGQQHLGLPHEQAVDQLIRIFLDGVRAHDAAADMNKE
jgi:AcrR family transcriptional regulator